MNEALQTHSTAPSRPKQVRSNLVGACACGTAGFSTIAVAGAFHIQLELVRYIESCPPGSVTGGAAFSLNFGPWMVTLVAIASGVIATSLLLISCLVARSRRCRLLTAVHVGAAAFLLPFSFLLFLYVSRTLLNQ